MMLQERDWENKTVYAIRNEAAIKIISDFLRFYERQDNAKLLHG